MIRRSEPTEVLFRIKRGLAGYVSYLAACEMNESFSEYVLYEPILRILTARGYSVKCECECPGIPELSRGDKKRIDFVAENDSKHFALEVKWAKSHTLEVTRDVEKLEAFHKAYPASHSFLCVFGRKTHIADIEFRNGTFKEKGKAVYAEFRRTRYGCRIFELMVA